MVFACTLARSRIAMFSAAARGARCAMTPGAFERSRRPRAQPRQRRVARELRGRGRASSNRRRLDAVPARRRSAPRADDDIVGGVGASSASSTIAGAARKPAVRRRGDRTRAVARKQPRLEPRLRIAKEEAGQPVAAEQEARPGTSKRRIQKRRPAGVPRRRCADAAAVRRRARRAGDQHGRRRCIAQSYRATAVQRAARRRTHAPRIHCPRRSHDHCLVCARTGRVASRLRRRRARRTCTLTACLQCSHTMPALQA